MIQDLRIPKPLKQYLRDKGYPVAEPFSHMGKTVYNVKYAPAGWASLPIGWMWAKNLKLYVCASGRQIDLKNASIFNLYDPQSIPELMKKLGELRDLGFEKLRPRQAYLNQIPS